MNTKSLKIFIEVSRSGSFSAAARNMGLTQPAISFQIRSLEKEYGSTLIDRSGGRCSLTDAGEAFLRYAQRIVKTEEELSQEMERRAALYQATGRFPEKLSEYNSQVSSLQSPVSSLPWIVAVFDEFTALMDEAGKSSDLYRLIGQLAMRGRKYGITLVLAGQDFKADLLNTRITNQLRTRVQFACATAYHAVRAARIRRGRP